MLNTDISYRSLMKKIGLQYFADGGTDGAEDKKDPTEDKSGAEKSKTFTQDEVSKMMTAEKNQGRLAVLKELGLEGDSKDIKKLLDAYKVEQETKKTDMQKKDEVITTLTEKEKAAAAKATLLEAKFTAIESGVNIEFVEDVLAIAMIKVTEAKDLKTVLTEMKTKYPTFFTVIAKEEKGTGGSVGGGKKTDDKTTESLGERLAKKNAPATKSAYFKN